MKERLIFNFQIIVYLQMNINITLIYKLIYFPYPFKDKKKQKRGGRGNVKAKKKAEPAMVKIGRVSRGKKKSVTHITGLGSYEIDLKKTAKMFGNKFACGSSSNEKADEIVIQGDFIDECIDMIIAKFPQIEESKIQDLGDIKK